MQRTGKAVDAEAEGNVTRDHNCQDGHCWRTGQRRIDSATAGDLLRVPEIRQQRMRVVRMQCDTKQDAGQQAGPHLIGLP